MQIDLSSHVINSVVKQTKTYLWISRKLPRCCKKSGLDLSLHWIEIVLQNPNIWYYSCWTIRLVDGFLGLLLECRTQRYSNRFLVIEEPQGFGFDYVVKRILISRYRLFIFNEIDLYYTFCLIRIYHNAPIFVKWKNNSDTNEFCTLEDCFEFVPLQGNFIFTYLFTIISTHSILVKWANKAVISKKFIFTFYKKRAFGIYW